MTPHTLRLHRVLTATPDRVYRAFTTPAALCKWLPPHGFTGEVQQMDAQVGGRWHMHFTNHSSGHSHGFGGTYLELVPGQRIRYTSVFDDPALAGEMVTTIDLRAVSCGVEVHAEQAGIPGFIPLEQCYLGWQQSMVLLAQLVEPEIPG